ncbi:MAG: glycine zipper 2TM domain-containing protein [Pseudomonadota bacterium]
MKKFNSFLLIGVALMGLTACDTMSPDQRAVAGGLGGAAVGGILGSTIGNGTGRTVATIAGAGLGAVAGSSLARGTNNNNNQGRFYRGPDGRLHPVQ